MISEIGGIFDRMTKTYCAISKLEFLLEAVRLTYENVSSNSHCGECFNAMFCGMGQHVDTPTHSWCVANKMCCGVVAPTT